ncbi:MULTISPECIES: DUF4884 domain-containing protein [unclassified Spirosoma]|uniref:DUF4884 domain-containing protein n=1 Tax=unclassified Spirosoma TaxID=2621999 RepID=UPI001ACFE111|nr:MULTISPECIES: DUF4884 domain-containing protein [unclassified Spirosoma]MBN8826104.1 DUF4884 domain-containing protein [Spirosoma sp.]
MKSVKLSLICCYLISTNLLSCLAPAQMNLQGSNPNIKVELLFEVDGCKVYRFYDRQQPRYFTKCQNGSSSVGWLESCGKNCTYYAENVTSYPKNGIPLKP